MVLEKYLCGDALVTGSGFKAWHYFKFFKKGCPHITPCTHKPKGHTSKVKNKNK